MGGNYSYVFGTFWCCAQGGHWQKCLYKMFVQPNPIVVAPVRVHLSTDETQGVHLSTDETQESGQWPVASGQWPVASGQLPVANDQWPVASGQ